MLHCSTITKASGGIGNISSQGGIVVPGNEFRGLSPRPPSTSKSWEATHQGPNGSSKNTALSGNAILATYASSSGILQQSSSDGMSDESNHIGLSSSVERSPPPFAKRY